MKLAIMQPYLFPYIGYFQLINAVDTFVVYDDVTYIKQGWINRNNILLDGEAKRITLPLSQKSSNTLIRDTFIDSNQIKRWSRKFMGSLEQAYKPAPNYSTVLPVVQRCMEWLQAEQPAEKSVAAFNAFCLIEICQHLGINTEFEITSTIYNNSHLSAQERVLDICAQENATQYINAAGGKELYDKPTFQKSNIVLNFISTNVEAVAYPQFTDTPVPLLSIIDVIMFNSKEQITTMLNSYELT